MRLLLLTQFFDPEPTLKGLGFAQELLRRGHTVEVLTGFPNYPGGQIYPGYRMRLYQREEIRGVVVHRVALFPSHNRSAIKRFLNYVSFAVLAAIVGLFVIGEIDAIYVHHPPITIGLPAVVLSRVTGAPFILEIQDLWPDTLRATGMVNNEVVLALTGRWAGWVYRRAAHISVISPGFRRALIARGVPGAKVSVLLNWCDESRIRPMSRDPALIEYWGLDNRFNVMFAGTMGAAQGLDTVLHAAALLRDGRSDIQFVLVGGGVDRDRLERAAADRSLDNVRFLPRQPIEAMGDILALADAVIVHLRRDPLFAITIPSKTQAYLCCGLPIIMAVDGDAAELIRIANAGITCPPESAQALAAAVAGMVDLGAARRQEMGDAGAEFYRRELSLTAGVARFEEQVGKALGGPA